MPIDEVDFYGIFAAFLDVLSKNAYGESISVAEKRRVSGGDINEAFVLQLSDGKKIFLKENAK